MTTRRPTPPPTPPTPEPRIVAAPEITYRTTPASLKNYSRTVRAPTLVVLHCTDGHEGPTKDRDVAAMFADPQLKPRRSAHFVVDTDSVTACVADRYTAWHCGPRGNRVGIGVELCGRATQTRAEWLDALSLPMLCLAARLVADRCRVWQIPPIVITARALVATRAPCGITTHAAVTAAWRESNHTDPGVGFPLDAFVRAVADALAIVSPPPPPLAA